MEENLNHSPDPEDEISSPDQVERTLTDLANRLTRQLEKNAMEEKERWMALNQREQALQRQEMQARGRDALMQRGLPGELAEWMNFEAETMEQGLNALENAFRSAVQKGVEERLLDHAPKAPSMAPLSELSDEDYYAALYRRD